MARKKISDVNDPQEVTPNASGRPIVVTNRSVLANDPMMVADDDAPAAAPTQVPVSRTSKTIVPVTSAEEMEAHPAEDIPEPDEPAPSEEQPAPNETASGADTATMPHAEPAEVTEQPAEPVPSEDGPSDPADTKDEPSEPAEKDAAQDITNTSAEDLQAAQAAREEALEQLIAKGTYAVPVNTVQRARSRMYIMLFCLLAIVLAVVLLDILLDAGVLKLSVNLPHTNFL